MALGDYNNNNNRKYYEPIMYSPYGTSNTEGVDPSALSFQFYNGLLKITISPMKPNANPSDRNIWDKDNAVSVWLTHIKAKMLYDEIKYALANPDTCFNAGVTTGNEGLISFSTGKELGVSSPCLIIRKIQDDGTVSSVYAYQFKDNYKNYKSVRNFDPANPSNYESHNYSNIEIDNLLELLKQYYESSGGAYAYSVMNGMRYDIQKNNTKMELIMEKLGIEKPDYSSNKTSQKGSFFSNNAGREGVPSQQPSRSMTMDEIESEME